MTGVDPRPLGLASMRRWRLSRAVRRLRPGLVGAIALPAISNEHASLGLAWAAVAAWVLAVVALTRVMRRIRTLDERRSTP